VHLKRRIVAMGIDDVINVRRYIRIFNARRYCGYVRRYKLLKNRVYIRLIIRYITQYIVE
jgi:hypothetical protein